MSTMPTTSSRVSAVFFDFAGVLTNDPFRVMATVASDHGFELAEFAAIAIGGYGDGEHPWHQLERGEIELADYESATDALARERGHGGFPPLPIEAMLALEVRPEMLELLGELRVAEIGTGIITNNVRALGAWRAMAEWDRLVDAVIDSCEVGMRKPEARIFDYACEQLGVSAADSLFLDDMPVNVEGAAAMGMNTLLVADPAAAVETVRQLTGL